MSYTSAALIAKEPNKPTVYYDSARILVRGNTRIKYIPFSSKQELHNWILNNI
jgi:hypothetical protein